MTDWRATDAELGLPDDDALRRLAATIDTAHAASPETRIVGDETRLSGSLGERQFAREFRLPYAPRVLRHGTRRQNFTLTGVGTIDVVTRRPQKGMRYPDLPVPVHDKHRVAVLVLAVAYDWETPLQRRLPSGRGEMAAGQRGARGGEAGGVEVELVGWIGKAAARHYPIRSFGSWRVQNHVVLARALQPILQLQQRAGLVAWQPTLLDLPPPAAGGSDDDR